MKILLITHYYEPEIGAPQRRWSAFVERWVQAGHQVEVLCPPPHYPDRVTTQQWRGAYPLFKESPGTHGETTTRMPYISHGFSGFVRLADQLLTAACSTAWAYGRHLKGHSPDLIITTVPGLPSLLAGSALAALTGIPHVAEFRDAWPDVVTGDLPSQVGRQSLPRRAFKSAIFRAVTGLQHQAALCITTTGTFAEVLAERGINRIAVISNGAELGHLLSLHHQERPDNVLRLQYLGTVGRSQGLSVLMDALTILKEQGYQDRVLLRVVGSGADLPQLKAQAQAQDLPVIFHPAVPRSQLAETYQWADVEIVSLKDTKPFQWTVPSKIFELLSTQRRIIGLVAGEAARILERSGVSSVVPPQDAPALAQEIKNLLEDPSQLQVSTMGRYLLYNDYSYDALARRYLQALERVLDNRTLNTRRPMALAHIRHAFTRRPGKTIS